MCVKTGNKIFYFIFRTGAGVMHMPDKNQSQESFKNRSRGGAMTRTTTVSNRGHVVAGPITVASARKAFLSEFPINFSGALVN